MSQFQAVCIKSYPWHFTFSNLVKSMMTSFQIVRSRVLSLLTNRSSILPGVRTFSNGISINDDAPIEMENPYKKEKRSCILCKFNIVPDYKNFRLLSQFQSPYTGRIYGRHITGLCKSKQELVESEIKKAQNCGYMPYVYKDRGFLKDPKLFDPENPIRMHRF